MTKIATVAVAAAALLSGSANGVEFTCSSSISGSKLHRCTTFSALLAAVTISGTECDGATNEPCNFSTDKGSCSQIIVHCDGEGSLKELTQVTFSGGVTVSNTNAFTAALEGLLEEKSGVVLTQINFDDVTSGVTIEDTCVDKCEEKCVFNKAVITGDDRIQSSDYEKFLRGCNENHNNEDCQYVTGFDTVCATANPPTTSPAPSKSPTASPGVTPTKEPTTKSTEQPTAGPSAKPTVTPTMLPLPDGKTRAPTQSDSPTAAPTASPVKSDAPTASPVKLDTPTTTPSSSASTALFPYAFTVFAVAFSFCR